MSKLSDEICYRCRKIHRHFFIGHTKDAVDNKIHKSPALYKRIIGAFERI